jgi:Holliday junction DNA helicase RuvB
VGQAGIKANLDVLIRAAQSRNEPIEHLLLYGPPGLGKTTLAHLIAKQMGTSVRLTSGAAIERAGDLAAILTSLAPGEILFVDEIHRLGRLVEEVLYPAMEDFALDLVVGKGPGARILRLDLPKFTLVGATTRYHELSAPLRDRFGATFRLEFYTPEEIEQIVARNAGVLGVTIDDEAKQAIARRSRFTPRVANRLLKRSRDYAQVNGSGHLTQEMADAALAMLDIDHLGLDAVDRRFMNALATTFSGGPAGLQALAAATSEELGTLEEVVEPYLLRQGLVARTSRGRVLTESGWRHLGLAAPVGWQSKLI